MDPIHVYLGEFVGTAILLALGNSVNASVLLKNTVAGALKTNWVVIVFGWCFAVAFGVYAALFLGAPAHLNPALSIALAVGGMFPQELVLGTICAQLAGGFVGATITSIHYYPHFKITGPDEGNCVGIFATGPAIPNNVWNLISEIIATFMFLFIVLLLGPVDGGMLPIVLGFLVASMGFSYGGTTGYALNPARDFAPRLAYTLLPIPNKGTANWGYAWIPVVGPIVGATLAVCVFKLLVG